VIFRELAGSVGTGNGNLQRPTFSFPGGEPLAATLVFQVKGAVDGETLRLDSSGYGLG